MPKPKKKLPADFQAFLRWLVRSPVHTTNVFILSLLLVMLPGQNLLQTLALTPQTSSLKPFPLDVTFDLAVPVRLDDSPEIHIQALAAYVIEPTAAAVLYQKNPHARLLPASITKIMTALVVLDEYPFTDIVTVGDADRSIGHRARLSSGEQFYVSELLKALLISSGNDAALALAQHHPLGYQHFIDLMNQKAQALNLTGTRYSNVSGIETPGHYTTVRDLAVLTKAALNDPIFRSTVSTKTTTITDITGTNTHTLDNINQLLGAVEGVEGVKTGWTQNAGECLVTYTVRQGHPLITVVLASPDRFGESRALIEWAYQNHRWVAVDRLLQQLSP